MTVCDIQDVKLYEEGKITQTEAKSCWLTVDFVPIWTLTVVYNAANDVVRILFSVEPLFYVTASPYSLGSACEEVQYPVAECCTQAQSDKFSNQLHG